MIFSFFLKQLSEPVKFLGAFCFQVEKSSRVEILQAFVKLLVRNLVGKHGSVGYVGVGTDDIEHTLLESNYLNISCHILLVQDLCTHAALKNLRLDAATWSHS